MSERQPLLQQGPRSPRQGSVAEYEFNKEKLTQEWEQGMLAQYLNPCCVPFVCCWLPKYCLVDQPNVQDKIASMRVFLTDENIEFEDGPYYTGFRFDCCGRHGKTHQVIPFDRVQDVRLVEPAGNFCFCFPFRNALVGVQTAGASAFPGKGNWIPGGVFQLGKSGGAEMDLWGLMDPHGFRGQVLDKKRTRSSRGDGVSGAGAAPALLGAPRVEEMLAEQNGLLKSIDASLRLMAEQQKQK